MELVITTHVSCGPFTFGMSRADARRIMRPAVPHERNPLRTLPPKDFYFTEGVFLLYSPEMMLMAVEVVAPSSVTIQGYGPLGRRFADVLPWFKEHDTGLLTDGAGLTSLKLGTGVYAPSAFKAPDEPVESVIAFAPGYYDGVMDALERV